MEQECLTYTSNLYPDTHKKGLKQPFSSPAQDNLLLQLDVPANKMPLKTKTYDIQQKFKSLSDLDIFTGVTPDTLNVRILRGRASRDAKANKKLEDIHMVTEAKTHKQTLAIAQVMLPPVLAQTAAGNRSPSGF